MVSIFLLLELCLSECVFCVRSVPHGLHKFTEQLPADKEDIPFDFKRVHVAFSGGLTLQRCPLLKFPSRFLLELVLNITIVSIHEDISICIFYIRDSSARCNL